MSIIQLVLWLLVGFLTGILVFLGRPLIVAMLGDYDRIESTSDDYVDMAMKVLRRGLLVDREHSGVDLVQSSFAPPMRAEVFALEGEVQHAKDHADLMDRLAGRPFGLVKEGYNVVLAPHLAPVGAGVMDLWESGEAKRSLTIDRGDGPESVNAWAADVTVPAGSGLVALSDARRMLPGTADLNFGELAKEFVKKSQLGFRGSLAAEHAMIIMAFAAGFALPVLAIWQFGSGGGGFGIADNFNLMVGVKAGVWP